MIRRPAPLEFTQGTIFSGAAACNYEGASVFGMVITARCDAAHEKVELYNYVPVIPLERWVLRDGRLIAARRVAAEARGSMRKVLTDAGMATAVLDVLPIKAIEAELAKDTSKNGRGLAIRFAKAQSASDAAERAASETISRRDSFEFLDTNSNATRSVLKELLGNSLAEFHYLDRVEPSEDTNGYVALLREVRFLTSAAARAVAEGLDKSTYEAMMDAAGGRPFQLHLVSEEDFCMPVGAVDSPFIELIMQRLTQLFSRVGVTDITPDRTQAVHAILDSIREHLE